MQEILQAFDLFLKYFKSSKDINANKIALDDAYAYSSNLENDIFQNTNAESETICNTNDFSDSNVDKDVNNNNKDFY